MSIFKKFVQLFKEDKPEPQVATGFEAYGVDSGGESQPKSRLYLEEMKGWVGACVSAIADEIGTIDIKLYKYTNGDIDEVTEHPMLDLLYNINNFTTKFDHFWVTQSYLELCGESPWFLDRENGKIVGIYFLRPDKFSLITDSTKLIEGYKYDIGNGKSIKLGLDEVIYLKIPNPAKPFRGIGTLEMARVSVDIDNYSEEWNKNFYKNSAHPDSVLKVGVTQMNEQQRGELKKSLRKNYASLKNSHKTMVLFGDMEFEKISSTQKDMDFLEQQKFSRDKILGIFRVPKAILAQTDGVNYAAAKAAYYIFSRFTIKPKMTRLVAQLNEFLLPMFSGTENMFFSFTSPVPEDEELKIKKHESALKSGWMTINEVRDTEGLAPVDGGDVIYQPMNMIALGTTLSVDETAKKFKYEIVAMKARNKKYFEIEKQIKETKIEMIEKVKSGIKKKLEEGETSVRILEDGEKMKVWEKKEVMFNKYLKRVKDGQEIIFREQRKIVMSKLNKLKSIKATPTNIYKDIKLNTNTEIARTLKIEFPIFEELFKDAGDETFKLLEVEMQMEIDTETRKLLKADTRKFAKAATLTTNESIKTLVTDIIGEGGSMLDLQKGLGTMFTKAEEYRAKRIAETETQRYNNSASEKAFIDSEVVESKEWFANPGACQFCQPLNGKSIGLGKSYFNKGDTASGNDGGSLNLDYDSTEHPPLHPNCRCILVPVFKPIKKDIKPKKDIKKPNLKEVIIVEVDKTEKEYKLKIKELEDKMKDINKIEGKTKKEEKQVKKEKEKLKELRKEIVKEFNTQQDVK